MISWLLGRNKPDALGVVRLRDSRVAWQQGLVVGSFTLLMTGTSSSAADLPVWLRVPFVLLMANGAAMAWARNTDVLIEAEVLSTDTGNVFLQHHWSPKDVVRIEVDVPWFRLKRVLAVRDTDDSVTPLRCCLLGTPNAERVLEWAAAYGVALDKVLTVSRPEGVASSALAVLRRKSRI